MRVWVEEYTAADKPASTASRSVLESQSGEAIAPLRTMRALPRAPWVAPGGDAPLDEAELGELAEAVSLVAAGEKAEKIVSKLGKHLFLSLLDENAWMKIKEAAAQGGTAEIQLASAGPPPSIACTVRSGRRCTTARRPSPCTAS